MEEPFLSAIIFHIYNILSGCIKSILDCLYMRETLRGAHYLFLMHKQNYSSVFEINVCYLCTCHYLVCRIRKRIRF